MTRLVECIPNFSCSKEKDEAAYNALVEVANSVPGCTLFDAQTDGNHNRCVFTLIGTPEAVEEVAFRLTKKAAEVIDMTKHHGEHSRMGATDVIPFVPTVNVTVEECVEISKRLGKRIWEELQIPSFLYEDSATSPDRVNLANVRKGQFEGMPEKLLQPEWAPDFGERKIHPTAGITAIGARMPLVAFNINLATSDVNIAKKIAKVIRGSSGGFKCCKAMGFMLEDRGIAQVSMNMVNYEVTPLTVVYEMVDSLAKRYGTYIVGSELVGLTPAKALLDCAEYYLKLENFDYRNQEPVEVGHWYDVRIEIRGNVWKCYMDGELKYSYDYNIVNKHYAVAGLDRQRNELVVKLVNGRTEPWQTTLQLKGGKVTPTQVRRIELSSESIYDENTFEEPEKIVGRESMMRIDSHSIPINCAPNSLTILRIPLGK